MNNKLVYTLEDDLAKRLKNPEFKKAWEESEPEYQLARQLIKKRLEESKIQVIGYDPTPEHTDIDDYTKLRPTKIISMDCFEHIPKDEIPRILENFRKMNSNVIMTFSIPTENFLSRKLRKLLGKPERANGHITTLKEILSIFEEKLELLKKKSLFTITFIGKYQFKK